MERKAAKAAWSATRGSDLPLRRPAPAGADDSARFNGLASYGVNHGLSGGISTSLGVAASGKTVFKVITHSINQIEDAMVKLAKSGSNYRI